MGREFELKFRATPEQQEAILSLYGDFSTITMETTYYDTPNGSLSARNITLRRRLENGNAVCTVKTQLDGVGRGEWETNHQRIEDAIPVLCKLGCTEDLIALTAPGLVRVCGARFTRQCKTLAVEGSTVELALDRGILLGGGRELPLCEVEVELKEGREDDALLFAQILAAKYGLQQETKSKFRRALDLAKER
jgi:triphosphatase